MSCEEDEAIVYEEKLADVELSNIDFSDSMMRLAKDSIKKEAFVIGVRLMSIERFEENDLNEPRFTVKINDFLNTSGKVRVYANTDFNAEYPAGSDVTHLFDMYNPKRNWLNTDNPVYFSYFLILKTTPEEGEYSFKIAYDFADEKENKTVYYTTSPVILY